MRYALDLNLLTPLGTRGTRPRAEEDSASCARNWRVKSDSCRVGEAERDEAELDADEDGTESESRETEDETEKEEDGEELDEGDFDGEVDFEPFAATTFELIITAARVARAVSTGLTECGLGGKRFAASAPTPTELATLFINPELRRRAGGDDVSSE